MSARILTWAGVAAVAGGMPLGAPPPATGKHRGVSWVAGRDITPLNIQPLVENRVNWIVQTPFGWQGGIDSPEIRLATKGGVLWGETDEGLAAWGFSADEIAALKAENAIGRQT